MTDQLEAIRAHVEKHAGKERATFSIAGIKALLAAIDNHDQKTGRTAQATPEGVPCGGVSRQDQVAARPEEALRRALTAVGRQVGAFLSDDVSTEFLLLVPEEVRLVMERRAQAGVPWAPTHRHVKRGSAYKLIGPAKLQSSVPLSDMDSMIVYQADDGTLWVRPHIEFFDGRFEPIEPA